MKIAVVYNRESKSVINLFGQPNKEKYGKATIDRISEALKKRGGHQVKVMEGDKELIHKLEQFMPRVVKGELPGMVLNLSYGIQGQARYTHVPGILEMVGVPYVGSGPLAHSLALDKVVAKMIFRQRGVPTPDFWVVRGENDLPMDVEYPVIVKPKNESTSFGITVAKNRKACVAAIDNIYKEFNQDVLVERYIEGREINVALLGNGDPQAFEPVELVFGKGGPAIYTYEDKVAKGERRVTARCPAKVSAKITEKAKQIAKAAFVALGCNDCARVDFRIDKKGNLWVLEINSLPSLGLNGSYVEAARQAGLEYGDLVCRMVEVASARYFGTPAPALPGEDTPESGSKAFNYIIERRDRLENRVEDWVAQSSRSIDALGLGEAAAKLAKRLSDLGLKSQAAVNGENFVWGFATPAWKGKGITLLVQLDVPFAFGELHPPFRRDPEWLYGEGIASSRAPLAMLEYALAAIKAETKLRKIPIRVLALGDEGRDGIASDAALKRLLSGEKKVLNLTPGNPQEKIIISRRGRKQLQLVVEGKSSRPGQRSSRVDVLGWVCEKLGEIRSLGSRPLRVSVAAVDLKTEAFHRRVPHRVRATLDLSFPTDKLAARTIEQIEARLGKEGPRWKLTPVSSRPPMEERASSKKLFTSLRKTAQKWDIPLSKEGSVWPSASGLVPAGDAVLCGMGPVAKDVLTPQAAVSRQSLVQRTLLLSQFLLSMQNEL